MKMVRINESYIGDDPEAPAQIVLVYGQPEDADIVNEWIEQNNPNVRCGPAWGAAGIGFWDQAEYEQFEQHFSQEEWINALHN